jgi:2-oxoglutarate dehydrogenase complex dehydrogenase (E1) component-like enzyme
LKEGLRFHRLYPEAFEQEIETDPLKIEKVILCSGQVYYDILEKRRKTQAKVLLIRNLFL